jgi:nucleoside-diphosphate-sugar epimerase
MEASDARDEMVLVTGGSGFVGGWCVIELLRRGHRVRTTIRDLAREAALRERLAAVVDPGDRLSVVAADLSEDAGWTEAVDGVPLVLHVASPFPPAQPKDPDELIVPARDGTLRVLRAALAAGAERVVVTSSVAAVGGGAAPGEPLDESDWTDLDHPGLSPYVRSKTIAERAAWELVRDDGDESRLAVVNPGAILGPVLSEDRSFSLQVIERLLEGTPGIPRIGFSIVDARDVADLHLRAMTAPEAGGERFIAVGEFAWMADVAAILRERLGPAAENVPSRNVPNLLVRAMAIFDPGIRSIVGQLGRRSAYSSEKARRLLGWSPRPLEETVVETAESMVSV